MTRLYNKRTHEYATLLQKSMGGDYFTVQYERDDLIAVAPSFYFEEVTTVDLQQFMNVFLFTFVFFTFL